MSLVLSDCHAKCLIPPLPHSIWMDFNQSRSISTIMPPSSQLWEWDLWEWVDADQKLQSPSLWKWCRLRMYNWALQTIRQFCCYRFDSGLNPAMWWLTWIAWAIRISLGAEVRSPHWEEPSRWKEEAQACACAVWGEGGLQHGGWERNSQDMKDSTILCLQ